MEETEELRRRQDLFPDGAFEVLLENVLEELGYSSRARLLITLVVSCSLS